MRLEREILREGISFLEAGGKVEGGVAEEV
jgi:hypothetical protein